MERKGSGELEETDRDFRARVFFSRMLRGTEGERRLILMLWSSEIRMEYKCNNKWLCD